MPVAAVLLVLASLEPMATMSDRRIDPCNREFTMPDQTCVSQNTVTEMTSESPTKVTETSELHWTAIIVVTIHQPNSKLFQMFSKALLLGWAAWHIYTDAVRRSRRSFLV
jgi:3-oxoacyl-[acyl-carrier-protein] synthase III